MAANFVITRKQALAALDAREARYRARGDMRTRIERLRDALAARKAATEAAYSPIERAVAEARERAQQAYHAMLHAIDKLAAMPDAIDLLGAVHAFGPPTSAEIIDSAQSDIAS